MKFLLLIAIITSCGFVASNAAETPLSREQITFSFAPLVKQSAPSVVNIYTKKVVHAHPNTANLFDNPLFKKFNKLYFGKTEDHEQSSLGSGVIIQPDGVVVTNNHLIKGADEIRVVMTDRREFAADVIMVDKHTDIAVLRLRNVKEELPSLEFGDSDDLLVGDLVLAIGNPFGVGQTITSGIVSGLARSTVGLSDFQSFIQTDAAINPGNSGGALVSLTGKVVGINTMIFSKTGGSLGIGFSVPSNMVRAVVGAALKGRRLVRPWLGFVGRDMTQDIASALGIENPMGVVVVSIYEGGPADMSGLQEGDIIMSIASRAVESEQDMRYRMATRGIDSDIEISYLRDKKIHNSRFELIAPPETPLRDEFDVSSDGPLQGTKVMNLSPALSEELGISMDQHGVIIVEVNERSTAKRLGVKPGDKILSINEMKIDRVSGLKKLLKSPPAEWHLVMNRGGGRLILEVR